MAAASWMWSMCAWVSSSASSFGARRPPPAADLQAAQPFGAALGGIDQQPAAAGGGQR